MTEVPKPLDVALDLFIYAPVGLAMTAAEELPKLAAKGRTRVNTQLTMARLVGQFAVSRGRQELEKRFAPPAADPGPLSDPAPASSFEEMTAANGSAGPGHPANGSGSGSQTVPSAAVADVAAGVAPVVPLPEREGPAPAPAAADLAIPGYDSLSASQVVQRLAGLSGEELRAVAAYEQAHRGRRTILNRIDQLQKL